MASLFSLWLPILVSAVVVFIASSIIHMMFTYHKNDLQKLPNEDDVLDALRPFNVPEGEYSMPYCGTAKGMKDPTTVEKFDKGPVAVLAVWGNGMPKMGKNLIQWFIYIIVVSIFAAYIASHALNADAVYLEVFRFVGCTAFIGYAVGNWQSYIWWRKSLRYALFSSLDGLIYACLTAGVFGWLW